MQRRIEASWLREGGLYGRRGLELGFSRDLVPGDNGALIKT